MMPIATPKPIVDTVNRWFSQIVGTPETRKFLADSGADPMINTPERSQEMFQAAIKEWEALVRMAKIEPQ
jgi:tripartite-type tricarboxylate transporter receptor subunit TctC